jgi:hypothetical protein
VTSLPQILMVLNSAGIFLSKMQSRRGGHVCPEIVVAPSRAILVFLGE